MSDSTLAVPLSVTLPFVPPRPAWPATKAPGAPPNAAATVPSFGNHFASGAPAVFVVFQFCVVFTSHVPVPARLLFASQKSVTALATDESASTARTAPTMRDVNGVEKVSERNDIAGSSWVVSRRWFGSKSVACEQQRRTG